MSDYASTLERTREAFAALARLEAAMARAPGDPALEMNFRARKRLAERYQGELFSLAEQANIEVCQYRLIPNNQRQHYPIGSIAKSISVFQELFTLIFASVKTGVKKRARVSAAISAHTELEFGYTYPGSLGLVMTVPSSRDLFSGEFDQSLDTLNQVMGIANRGDVVEIARHYGAPIVTRAYWWSSENYKGDFSVDVTWRRSDGQQRGTHVAKTQMAKIIEMIEQTSDQQTAVLPEMSGILVGWDTPTRWFHFVVPGGESYQGTLGKDFPAAARYEVNRSYRAVIAETTVVHFATEKTTTRYELRVLKEEKSS